MECIGLISTKISESKASCSASIHQRAPLHLTAGYNVAKKSFRKMLRSR
jgi:hypothetical protein